MAAPIIDATKVSHIEEAAAALEIDLTSVEIATLEAHYIPHPILGHNQPSPRESHPR